MTRGGRGEAHQTIYTGSFSTFYWPPGDVTAPSALQRTSISIRFHPHLPPGSPRRPLFSYFVFPSRGYCNGRRSSEMRVLYREARRRAMFEWQHDTQQRKCAFEHRKSIRTSTERVRMIPRGYVQARQERVSASPAYVGALRVCLSTAKACFNAASIPFRNLKRTFLTPQGCL